MPEDKPHLVGVPDASYLKPLIYGLSDGPGELQLRVDSPAQLALTLQQRTEPLRCAFLSPIDYARYGSDYLIVPGVCAASLGHSNTVKLYINHGVSNIDRIAVDVRVTSEIILAKILLAEKFPNLASDVKRLQFVPVIANLGEMLRKADAALVVNFHPEGPQGNEPFSIDLVDEWNDLTGLPYVHGFWVGHDEPEAEYTARKLQAAKELGMTHLAQIAQTLSRSLNLALKECKAYFAHFHYELGDEAQDGISEFIRYAYYHGVLPDVPDLNFFEIAPLSPPTIQ